MWYNSQGYIGHITLERGGKMQIMIGHIVEGTVSGIQPYGAFVKLDSDYKGLIHISEISKGYVKDVAKYLHVGEKVKVKVIDIDPLTHQCKLSLKAIQSNQNRARNKSLRVQRIPKMVLGFSTLEKHLDEWIKQANNGR